MFAFAFLLADILAKLTALTNAAAGIDAAIVAKGGVTAGGLLNAPAAIASLPSGGAVTNEVTWYCGFRDEVVDTRQWTTNVYVFGSMYEYLEGTGTQYVDTGFNLTGGSWMEVDYDNDNGTRSLIGNRGSPYYCVNFYNSRVSFGYNGSWYYTAGHTTGRHTLRFEAGKVYEDGSLIYNISTVSMSCGTAWLFNENPGSGNGPMDGRIYYADFGSASGWDMEFVPLVDTNGVPCMADVAPCRTNGFPVLKYNIGSGAFGTSASPTGTLSVTQVTMTGSIVTNIVDYAYAVTNRGDEASAERAVTGKIYRDIEAMKITPFAE